MDVREGVGDPGPVPPGAPDEFGEGHIPDKPEPEKLVPQGMMVRVESWSAWLPLHEDPNNPEGGGIPGGIVGLKMLPGEILQDLDVTSLPVQADAVEPGEGEDEESHQPMQLFGFEAILVRQFPRGYDPKDILTPQPSPEDSKKMIDGFLKAKKSAAKQAEIAAGMGTRGHKAPGGGPRPIR
jgi:hypothetical protein